MNNFTALNEETRKEMLESISKSNIDELFEEIPQNARMQSLDLPNALNEMQAQRVVKDLAKANNSDYIYFVGAGTYNKFIPAAVSQVAQRFEFLTAYTPYQPEIAQGTLQIMYEFQSLICRLTGMPVSNASMYDGASAAAEAVIMAKRVTKKNKVLISDTINPEYIKVIQTYAWANEIELEMFDTMPENVSDYAGVVVQNPNFFGEIKEIKKSEGALLIVITDVSSLAILTPPAEYGADIVVGDIQTLGIPMSFGGPHAGFMSCTEKLMRQLPGRLAGKTVDADGKIAYTLTIQTREQHIKREKATSNICSNQALIALCATLYLSLLGEKGFKQASYLSSKNAHDLAKKLEQKGYKVLSKDFYNEFLLNVEHADSFLTKLKEQNIIGGYKVDEKTILVCATEMNSPEDIELYVKSV
ncbi:MAG: aminomethyl-transferring glycine dehydrogenase subunit GcvPA [Candidatus Melainabacteria bacterium]|nr:MAG: aminomethyl-transferring glycine dehydrogenase subunit GcvPA [Candidatus Melainabacteria bacterium]